MKRARRRLGLARSPAINGPAGPAILVVASRAIYPAHVDVPMLVDGLLTLLPELMQLRPRIVEETPHFDLAALDQLEDYAKDLLAAHNAVAATAEYLAALGRELEPLYQALQHRRRLVATARSLAKVGLVDPTTLANVSRQSTLRATADDLMTLHGAISVHLETIENTAALHLDLVVALLFANRINAALSAHAEAGANHQTAPFLRTQAFTVVARAYAQVQHAATFVLWNTPDRDRLARSLYSLGNARR